MVKLDQLEPDQAPIGTHAITEAVNILRKLIDKTVQCWMDAEAYIDMKGLYDEYREWLIRKEPK